MKRMMVCLVLVVVAGVVQTGCDAVNPQRPTQQPDSILFGNLLEVEPSPQEEGYFVVSMRIGMPRAMVKEHAADGRPTPPVEKGTTAEITVTPDTVVLLDGESVGLEAFDPGTELVAIPVSGTTLVVGTAKILQEASFLLDFGTYQRWQLPELPGAAAKADKTADDPARINSSGVEHSPVPLSGGRVLYFAARLRRPASAGQEWIGARREGLFLLGEEVGSSERSYRTELGEDGWSSPQLVQLPGTEAAAMVRVTWVNEDETVCLATVQSLGEPSWVGRSERAGVKEPWQEVTKLEVLGPGREADAAYLTGSKTKLVFVKSAGDFEQSDLFLLDPKIDDSPLLLERSLNTGAGEWAPRTGPENELFFCRGDRQMLLKNKRVRPVRLPGPHRQVLTQANPTLDGAWVFLCLPEFTPLEYDQDIHVAAWTNEENLGEPVTVDDWRPE